MINLLGKLVHHFLTVDTVLVASSWATALGGAVFHYAYQHKAPSKSIKGFFKFALPSQVWQHPSCRRDYVFAAFNHLVESFTIAPLLIGIVTVSAATYSAMAFSFGPITNPPMIHWPLWVALLFLMIMIQDFATWITHYLEHRLPVLWAIHRVHHSAEFMTPLSNRRHHPLQLVWEGGVSNVLSGLFIGIASYLAGVKLIGNLFLGIDGYYLASVLSFYQLRHSHIPLHYGKFDKWFLSPASHQKHHSVEVQDLDKNFSLLTSIWDRLFGTYNPPIPGETFRIGLVPKEQAEFQTVRSLWLQPFVDIFLIAKTNLAKPHISHSQKIEPISDQFTFSETK